MGTFHPNASDRLPPEVQTLVLLGPAEQGFWAHFTHSPEACDGQPNPMDRWSTRVIGKIAEQLGHDTQPLFPFGGKPFHPFYSWALRSGRAFAAPVHFLVHDTAGLHVSYRGALALTARLDIAPPNAASPCYGCAQKPCLTACPVQALGPINAGRPTGYNVDVCQTHLGTAEGQACMDGGCLARGACPVSQRYGRLAAQSSFHMRQFKK